METNPLVEIYRSPLVPRPDCSIFVFFEKMFLSCFEKVDLLEVARGGGVGRGILVGVGEP